MRRCPHRIPFGIAATLVLALAAGGCDGTLSGGNPGASTETFGRGNGKPSRRCGNGSCTADESCSSCPQDCGACVDGSAATDLSSVAPDAGPAAGNSDTGSAAIDLSSVAPDAGPADSCTGETCAGPPSTGFPNASNTGVPAGTTLTTYTGPCTITVANTVIDAKTVNCGLLIRAANVKITRSQINGTVATEEDRTGFSFEISDSNVAVGNRPGTGVGAVNFTAIRVHVTGGNRSMYCYDNCLIQDSYVHGQFRDDTGVYHESGIRMSTNTTLRHNTIACDAPTVPPDAGCSAPLTGYGDFAPVQNNLIEKNFFKATTGGACAYGGSSNGKPYSSGAKNIVFRDNVFEKGVVNDHGKLDCAYYFAVTDFNASAPGNQFVNNFFSDGSAVIPNLPAN